MYISGQPIPTNMEAEQDFQTNQNPAEIINQAEGEFEAANPFLQEDAIVEPLNDSVFSGVSDKSIHLRPSSGVGAVSRQPNHPGT